MLRKHEMADWQVPFDVAKKGDVELKLSREAKWEETGGSRVESTCHIQLWAGLINIKF